MLTRQGLSASELLHTQTCDTSSIQVSVYVVVYGLFAGLLHSRAHARTLFFRIQSAAVEIVTGMKHR
jgi:hypothetical protein